MYELGDLFCTDGQNNYPALIGRRSSSNHTTATLGWKTAIYKLPVAHLNLIRKILVLLLVWDIQIQGFSK